MTRAQFERWRDFALRMARSVYSAKMRMPSRKWVITRVEEFLAEMEEHHLRITDWDSTWAESPPRSYPCVSDRMSEFEWDHMPARVLRLECAEDMSLFEKARDRWFGPVNCCVRAGLDMASAPSAGVVGFTLGDLRKMYPEGIPAWLAGEFRDKRDRPYTPDKLKKLKGSEPVWL